MGSARLHQTVRRNAYSVARGTEMTIEEAVAFRAEAIRRMRAIADDPIKDAFAEARRRMVGAVTEARRLRRERDALLSALADALGTSETAAWQIARLDIEDDDKSEDVGPWDA